MEEYKRNIQFDPYIFELEEAYRHQCESNDQLVFNRSQILRNLYRQYLEVNTLAIHETGKHNSDFKEDILFKQEMILDKKEV